MVYNLKLLDSGETELEVFKDERLKLLSNCLCSLSNELEEENTAKRVVFCLSKVCDDDFVMRELHEEHYDDKR